MKKALGMIETVGLVPLMEAVDAMSKSAAVELTHWDTVGAGRVSAFFAGDVAAIKAAVDAGAEAAAKLGTVSAAQVIPNPDEGLSVFTGKGKKAKQAKEK